MPVFMDNYRRLFPFKKTATSNCSSGLTPPSLANHPYRSFLRLVEQKSAVTTPTIVLGVYWQRRCTWIFSQQLLPTRKILSERKSEGDPPDEVKLDNLSNENEKNTSTALIRGYAPSS